MIVPVINLYRDGNKKEFVYSIQGRLRKYRLDLKLMWIWTHICMASRKVSGSLTSCFRNLLICMSCATMRCAEAVAPCTFKYFCIIRR